MNKKELIDVIAEHAETTKEKAGAAFDGLFEAIERSLKKGEDVRVPGFGTFKVAKRAARMVRNPRTGETSKAPATKVARFTAAAALKEAVAGKKKK